MSQNTCLLWIMNFSFTSREDAWTSLGWSQMGPLPLTAHRQSCHDVTMFLSTMLQGALLLPCLCSPLPGSRLLDHPRREPLLDLLLHGHLRSPWLSTAKSWSTKYVSLLNAAYLLSIGLQLKISDFVAGQQKKKKKEKNCQVSILVYEYIYTTRAE